MYVKASLIVGTCLCRLQKQGMRVLVEKPVHRTEFPEFDAFDAEKDGTIASPLRKCITFALCRLLTSLSHVQIKLFSQKIYSHAVNSHPSEHQVSSFPRTPTLFCTWIALGRIALWHVTHCLKHLALGGPQTYQCQSFLNLSFSMRDAGCEHPPGLCMSQKKSSTYSAKTLYWLTLSHFSTQSCLSTPKLLCPYCLQGCALHHCHGSLACNDCMYRRLADLCCCCRPDVDFCVSLGGDGTVLHLTSLFVEDTPLPPVISFSMGTLGFLTPFDAGDFQPCLNRVLAANQDPVFCTLRTRKRCEVYW